MTAMIDYDIMINMGTMIIRNVPEDLRRDFKILCLRNNTNMTELIINLMRKEVAKGKPKK